MGRVFCPFDSSNKEPKHRVFGLWTEAFTTHREMEESRVNMNKGILIAPVFAVALGADPSFFAQQLVASASSVPPPAPVLSSAVVAKPSKPVTAKPELAASAPITWSTESSVGPAPVGSAKPAHTLFGKKKAAYAGPTELVVLTPTPVLDEHGQQKLD